MTGPVIREKRITAVKCINVNVFSTHAARLTGKVISQEYYYKQNDIVRMLL